MLELISSDAGTFCGGSTGLANLLSFCKVRRSSTYGPGFYTKISKFGTQINWEVVLFYILQNDYQCLHNMKVTKGTFNDCVNS